MSTAAVLIADILFWPTVQLSVSATLLRLPLRFITQDNALTRISTWEYTSGIYKHLRIRQWKKHLPDGGRWLGAPAKRVAAFSATRRNDFLAETRRAELAHWLQFAFVPVCWLWNPPCACAVMLAYAVLTNMPCILAQRYNRALLTRRTIHLDRRSTTLR